MNVSLEVLTIDFDGKLVDADKLHAALIDPNSFYRFRPEGEKIEIERYDIRDVEQLVKL
jgi:hypothetical protein